MELDIFKSAPERAIGARAKKVNKAESKIVKKIKYHKPVRNFVLNYTPIIFAIAFIAIVSLFAVGYASYNAWKQKNTENEGNAADATAVPCHLDFDCNEGWMCYNSITCSPSLEGKGICGSQMGDMTCHKLCTNEMDCPPKQTCNQIEISRGDIILIKRICMSG